MIPVDRTKLHILADHLAQELGSTGYRRVVEDAIVDVLESRTDSLLVYMLLNDGNLINIRVKEVARARLGGRHSSTKRENNRTSAAHKV